MGQVHHGCATTTAAIRRAIQHSQGSLRQPATRYGIDPETVAKWKKRSSTADRKTGPSEPKSTVLSGDDEAVVVAFRRHTLLPLDDCLVITHPLVKMDFFFRINHLLRYRGGDAPIVIAGEITIVRLSAKRILSFYLKFY